MDIAVIFGLIIQFAPLLGFIVAIFWGKRMGEPKSAYFPTAMLGVSFLASIALMVYVLTRGDVAASFEWIRMGNISLTLGFNLDRFTAVMALVVSSVSFMIHIYSIGYMHGETYFGRFFAYLNLFTFSMLGLVLADNFLQAFIFWELVGLTSYLLIGFYFDKDSACFASMKAFITTKAADVGLMLALFMILAFVGSFDFKTVFHAAEHGVISPMWLTVIALLIFMGAAGKSAQLPFHVWLPDAMEGPTPVSALIHAATMVAAGVYLVARSFPLFEASGAAMTTVAIIGGTTAIFAATIAMVQVDIKRVLAYSTLSQLGYMMLALGVGNPIAAIFHLFTHAFFKALLFLGSGSMIHATRTQDIREMGGLFGKMKITGWTFIIGSLALAGIPPLAGFFSKDEILGSVAGTGNYYLIAVGFITAMLTAYYMFRAIYISFFGKPMSEGAEKAHESPVVMTFPLVFLTVLSVIAGFVFFIQPHGFGTLSGIHMEHHHPLNFVAMGASVVLALLGILIATAIYKFKFVDSALLYRIFRPIAYVLEKKYFFDEVYGFVFVKGAKLLANVLGWFDMWVIDGLVNLSAFLTVLLSRFEGWFDLRIVDGLVNFTGWITALLGRGLRRFQTGYIQEYIIVLAASVVVIIIFALAMM